MNFNGRWILRNGTVVKMLGIVCYATIADDDKYYFIDGNGNGIGNSDHDLVRKLPEGEDQLI